MLKKNPWVLLASFTVLSQTSVLAKDYPYIHVEAEKVRYHDSKAGDLDPMKIKVGPEGIFVVDKFGVFLIDSATGKTKKKLEMGGAVSIDLSPTRIYLSVGAEIWVLDKSLNIKEKIGVPTVNGQLPYAKDFVVDEANQTAYLANYDRILAFDLKKRLAKVITSLPASSKTQGFIEGIALAHNKLYFIYPRYFSGVIKYDLSNGNMSRFEQATFRDVKTKDTSILPISPKGVAVSNGRIFVTNTSGLVVYNTGTGMPLFSLKWANMWTETVDVAGNRVYVKNAQFDIPEVPEP